MNPTLPFIRKLLLTFISRLGAAEGDKNKGISSTDNQESNVLRQHKNILK